MAAEGVVRDSVEADAGRRMMDGQGGPEAGTGVEIAKRPLPRRATGGRANQSRRPGRIDRYGEGIERTGQPLAARLDEKASLRVQTAKKASVRRAAGRPKRGSASSGEK